VSDRKAARAASVSIVRAGRQHHLLTEPITYEEEKLPGFVRAALIAVAALLVLFTVWAGMVRIEELAVAPGQVVPSGKVKVVQHLEGGVVARLLIAEGERVEPDQVLVVMDAAQAMAEWEQMKAREAGLLVRMERLRATVDGREPDFSAFAGRYPDLVSEQRKVWAGQRQTTASALAVVEAQVAQRHKELKQLADSLEVARQHMVITGEQLGIREKGVAAGIVSRQIYLETKRAFVTAEGEVARIEEQIRLSRDALSETEQRGTNLDQTHRQEALNDLGSVVAELEQVKSAQIRLEDRVNRLEVRSPDGGIVQDLRVRTQGEVVQPGGLLMTVVPVEDQLEAEVRVSSADIGHVEVGQPVKLKVATYDFTRYGAMDGELVRLSATTFLDEQGKPYYKAIVRLARSHMGPGAGENPILPGMTVEADIITGDKSLLEYLLKPVHLAFKNAFHER
jgi:adhesin transport system membrane fusion protein